MGSNIKCLVCDREIKTCGAKKYCSHGCYSIGRRGTKPWNSGMKYSEEMKSKLDMSGLDKGRYKGKKMPPAWNKGTKGVIKPNKTSFKKGDIRISGKNNLNWKNNDVGYSALHDWVYRVLGIPDKCKNCGKTEKIQWANKSHEYKRERDDWIKLCYWCHRKYDRSSGWGKAIKKYEKLRKRR